MGFSILYEGSVSVCLKFQLYSFTAWEEWKISTLRFPNLKKFRIWVLVSSIVLQCFGGAENEMQFMSPSKVKKSIGYFCSIIRVILVTKSLVGLTEVLVSRKWVLLYFINVDKIGSLWSPLILEI